MKSVTFFRNPWKKRNKDKNETQDVSTTKRAVLVPESAPCTPMATAFEIPAPRFSPSPGHGMRSQSQDAIAFQVSATFARRLNSPPSSASSTCSLVDEEITRPPLIPGHHNIDYPHYPVLWKSSHGPPKNTFHGPPNLGLYSPVSGSSPRSTGGNPPIRPPRPPPLNLYPTTVKRPSNTGLPPRLIGNRAITFSLPPNPRAIKTVELSSTTSNSSDDSPKLSEDQEERASQSSEETARCICATTSPNDSHICPHRSTLPNRHTAANIPPLPMLDPPLSSSLRTAQALLDLSDAPGPKRMYQSNLQTSSSPHLPFQGKQDVPPLPSLRFDPSTRQADDVSDFPLSLYPTPPQSPLFIRRKISKNLVLRPSSKTLSVPLPPSPPFVSPDYTPPTTPRLPMSPNHSKFYSSLPRSPRVIPPALFDPPSTPLPTPPATPASPAPRGRPPSPPSLAPLRSVRSVNQLPCEQFLPPLVHRATSSEPLALQNGTRPISKMKRGAQPRPGAIYQAYPSASCIEK